MQRAYNLSLTVNCDKQTILSKLRENREKHSVIVKEAREGYLKKAKNALQNRILELEATPSNVLVGKIVGLNFSLSPPVSHLSAYDTVIKMLELHSEPTIQLSANEVSQFVEDKWEWSERFITSNSVYSQSAQYFLSEFNDD
jgi:hypothetical protein